MALHYSIIILGMYEIGPCTIIIFHSEHGNAGEHCPYVLIFRQEATLINCQLS